MTRSWMSPEFAAILQHLIEVVNMEIIMAIAIGLATGVVAGVYSGLVVARVSRFEELRNELKRIIHGVE